MLERVCVPRCHSLTARHVNCAAAGAPVRASRAPSSAATLTPLLTVWVVVAVVMVDLQTVVGKPGGCPTKPNSHADGVGANDARPGVARAFHSSVVVRATLVTRRAERRCNARTGTVRPLPADSGSTGRSGVGR